MKSSKRKSSNDQRRVARAEQMQGKPRQGKAQEEKRGYFVAQQFWANRSCLMLYAIFLMKKRGKLTS